jgi:hypothetical protein
MNKAVATISGVRIENGKGEGSFKVEEKTRLARARG